MPEFAHNYSYDMQKFLTFLKKSRDFSTLPYLLINNVVLTTFALLVSIYHWNQQLQFTKGISVCKIICV